MNNINVPYGSNDSVVVADMISRLELKSRDGQVESSLLQNIVAGVLDAAAAVSASSSSPSKTQSIPSTVVDQILPLASEVIRNSIQNQLPGEPPLVIQASLGSSSESMQATAQRLGRNQEQSSLESLGMSGVELRADGSANGSIAGGFLVAVVAGHSILPAAEFAKNLTSPIVSMSLFDGESKDALHRGMQMRMTLPKFDPSRADSFGRVSWGWGGRKRKCRVEEKKENRWMWFKGSFFSEGGRV